MREVIWASVLCLAASAASAADWPNFLGPSSNGTSPEKNLASSFPGGAKILWSSPAGPGYSGPAVHSGRVYLLDRKANQDILRCIDIETGKDDWTYAYDAPGKISHDGPRSTPAIDHKYVFIVGPLGHVTALDKSTHKPVWTKHLLKDFGGSMPTWAVAQSPVLHKDTVVLAPQSVEAGLVAWEKATGNIVWKSPGIGGMKYSTPLLTTLGGVEQFVMLTATGVFGIEPGTGNILWSFKAWSNKHAIPQATPIGDGRLFLTAGYDSGSAMIQVERAADGAFAAKELFRSTIGSQLHNAMLVGGHLYLNGNTNSVKDGFVCMSLDGKVTWKANAPPMDRGNFILADGVFYAMAGGTLRVIEPSPAGLRKLASAPNILAGKEIWAPMALSNGRLIVRDQSSIKCVAIGG